MIALLIQPIIAFLGVLFSRLVSWFLTAYLSGALRSLVIWLVLFTTLATLIYNLIYEANAYLLQAVQGMSPITQAILTPFAAMLPPSLGLCVSIIVTVELMTVIYNISKEIAKMKAKAAERAAGFFKA